MTFAGYTQLANNVYKGTGGKGQAPNNQEIYHLCKLSKPNEVQHFGHMIRRDSIDAPSYWCTSCGFYLSGPIATAIAIELAPL